MTELLIRNASTALCPVELSEDGPVRITDGRLTWDKSSTITGEYTEVEGRGWYLIPALTDHHCHVFASGTDAGFRPELYAYPQGCTYLVDAGSCGTATYRAFINEVISRSAPEIYSYLNVASAGQVSEHNPEYVHPDYFYGDFPAFLKAHPEIRGLKLRFDRACTRELGLLPLIKAAEAAHALNVPLSVHIAHHPCTLREILAVLDKGDIVCHMYQNSAESILDTEGKVKLEVREARKRGVLFESADGFANCSLKVARKAIAEGFKPDIISTDLTREKLHTLRGYGLAFTLAKYHALGLNWEEVIRAATLAPQQVLFREQPFTFGEGAPASVVLCSLEKTPDFTFMDSEGTVLPIRELLNMHLTVHRGEIVYCPQSTLPRLKRISARA